LTTVATANSGSTTLAGRSREGSGRYVRPCASHCGQSSSSRSRAMLAPCSGNRPARRDRELACDERNVVRAHPTSGDSTDHPTDSLGSRTTIAVRADASASNRTNLPHGAGAMYLASAHVRRRLRCSSSGDCRRGQCGCYAHLQSRGFHSSCGHRQSSDCSPTGSACGLIVTEGHSRDPAISSCMAHLLLPLHATSRLRPGMHRERARPPICPWS